MDDKKIMQQYYESELEKIKAFDNTSDILETESFEVNLSKKLSLENVFGCLLTAGYLLSVFAPESWFSFGKFLFSFRLGFLF